MCNFMCRLFKSLKLKYSKSNLAVRQEVYNVYVGVSVVIR